MPNPHPSRGIVFIALILCYAAVMFAVHHWHKDDDAQLPTAQKIRLEISRAGEVEYLTAPVACVIHVIADENNKLIDIQAIPDEPLYPHKNGKPTDPRITQTLSEKSP